MNTIVCIKQVPAVINVRLNEERWTVVREGVPNIINPFDLHAIEAAITLKETYGGTVTVLTMAPPQGEEALIEAIAMGADRGVLLSDRAFSGADTLATSHTLAMAILRLRPFDLIICGTHTTDSSTAQVGAQIAEELDIPYISCARNWHIEDGRIWVQRRMDGFIETLDCPIPALISISHLANKPRLPSLASIERAVKGGEIIRWGLEDIGADPERVGQSGSATMVRGISELDRRKKTIFLRGEPEEIVDALIRYLEERHLIE